MSKNYNTYPNRWIVKTVEALLVCGLIFFGLDALGNFLTIDEPVVDEFHPYAVDSDDAFRAQDYWRLALDHQTSGEYAEAVEDYNRVLQLDARLVGTYLNRGVAYEQMHDRQSAMLDFDMYLDRDNVEILDRGIIEDGETVEAYMSINRVLEYDFYAKAGQVLTIDVQSGNDYEVDPLIVVVDADGYPVAASDDILRQDGSYISMDSLISNQLITRSGDYTLRVSHAGGGEYGEILIDFELE